MAFYRPIAVRDYLELVRRILRRKWLILGVFLAVMVIAAAAVWRMPKMYKSTALILIQPGQMNTAAVAVVTNLEQRMRTLRPTITSRTELEAIVEDLNLYPEMRVKAPIDDAIEVARKHVEVEVQGRDLFRVSFVHDEAKVAQTVTERLSRKLIDESASDDVKSAREKVDFLRQRTDELKRQQKEWDAKIQQFTEDNADVLLLEQGAAAPLAAFREQLRAIDTELKAAERGGGGRRPRRTGASGGGALPLVEDPEVRQIRQQVEEAQTRLDSLRLVNTETHPDVVTARKQVQALQGQLARAMARVAVPPPTPAPSAAPSPERRPVASPGTEPPTELARLKAERDAVVASIEKLNTSLHELPKVRGQLGELDRERRRVTEALDMELRRLAEAESGFNVVAANKGDTFKVQDPANLPTQPDSPKRGLVLAAAAILGLLIALGVALVLVYFDQTVYNEYELSRVTDLPVLVSITEYDITGPDMRQPPPAPAPPRGRARS